MSTEQVEEQASAAANEALTENTVQAPPEVDFARILSGDEEYLKQTNATLAGEEAPPTAEKEPDAKTEEAAPPAATAPDPEEIVETITYRGQEVPVKRSQMKDLLQKGRHLETRLQEVSPLLALAREVPELVEQLRTPEGRKAIIERIRQQEKAKAADDDLPEVEGYDKADVKAVDSILRARMKALGIEPEQGRKPSPEQVQALERDQADLAAKTRITLESLQSVDPHYEQNMTLLKEVVAEIERTAPAEQFQQFFQTINDPRAIDPNTGRPAFLNFYADIDRERARRESLTKPAAPEIPQLPARRAQASSGRLAPGSAATPAAAAPTKDWFAVPKTDFDRAFDEALSRG